ncbi:Hypothetical protein A7982_03567 [Minicystis rosea]|nr:Hypothetical protein A7982_03567 [Minicystis rosea]
MSSSASRVGRALFIIPAAHYRIFDHAYQHEMYELFHRESACRIGHMICTPTIMLGVFVSLRPIGVWGAPVDAALLLAMILLGLYARMDRWVGLVMMGPVGLVYLGARWLDGALGARAAAVAMGLIIGGMVLQTLSHIAEDIPPPTSGEPGWVPLSAWARAAGPVRFLTSACLFAFVFTFLELWATPRVWSLQGLHVLMRFGYRPELRRRTEARVAAMLREPELAQHPAPPLQPATQ